MTSSTIGYKPVALIDFYVDLLSFSTVVLFLKSSRTNNFHSISGMGGGNLQFHFLVAIFFFLERERSGFAIASMV